MSTTDFGNNRFPRLPWVLLGLGIVCLGIGTYIGLFVAPPEELMGQVQRIMYVHVPTAWNALLAMTFAFVCAIVFLFNSDWKWDERMEAAIEVGVVLAFLLCCQGSIWAKPTWGVWWDWDPRLTTTAVLLFAFLGILALRKFVDDPVRRAIWSAVATIIAYVDVPIV
jgi:heme exporter protein C